MKKKIAYDNNSKTRNFVHIGVQSTFLIEIIGLKKLIYKKIAILVF